MKKLLFSLFIFFIVLGSAACSNQATQGSTDFNGLYPVVKEGKYGFIDKTGKVIIDYQYEFATFYKEDLAAVQIAGKYGFIDDNGEYVINPQFDYVDDFSEGLAPYWNKGNMSFSDEGKKLYGYIDQTGKVVIEPLYVEVDDFQEGLAVVKDETDDRRYYIDSKGETALNGRKFHSSYRFSNGLASASINITDGEGYVNKEGEFVITPDYFMTFTFEEGLAEILNKDGKYGVINTTGEVVVEFKYDKIFIKGDNGLFPVHLEGKWGYINQEEEMVIQPQFDYALPFINKLALVGVGKKKGHIDEKGKVVIQPIFDSAESFYEELARVSFVGESGYVESMACINQKGEYVWGPELIEESTGGEE